jgi:signal peptidase II
MSEGRIRESTEGWLLVPGLTFCLALALDQITKHWIASAFPLHHSRAVWGDFIHLTHVRNPGGVFGIPLGGTLPLLPVLLSIVLLVILYRMKFSRGQTPKTIALALIAAGACGNLIDRLRFGEVIDFIDVGIRTYRWPVFNIADAAVTVGVLVILILAVRPAARKRGPGGATEGAACPPAEATDSREGAKEPEAGAERENERQIP